MPDGSGCGATALIVRLVESYRVGKATHIPSTGSQTAMKRLVVLGW